MSTAQFIGARANALNTVTKPNAESLNAINRMAAQKKEKAKEDEKFEELIGEQMWVDEAKIHPKWANEVKQKGVETMSKIMRHKEESPYQYKTKALNEIRNYRSQVQNYYIPSSKAAFELMDAEKKGHPVNKNAVQWLNNGLDNDLDFKGQDWEDWGVYYDPQTRFFQAAIAPKTTDMMNKIKSEYFPDEAYRKDYGTGGLVAPTIGNVRDYGNAVSQDMVFNMPEGNVMKTAESMAQNPAVMQFIKTSFLEKLQSEQPDYDYSNREQMAKDLAAYTLQFTRDTAPRYAPVRNEMVYKKSSSDNTPPPPPNDSRITTGGEVAFDFTGIEPKASMDTVNPLATGRKDSGKTQFSIGSSLALQQAQTGVNTVTLNAGGGIYANTYNPIGGNQVLVGDPLIMETDKVKTDIVIKGRDIGWTGPSADVVVAKMPAGTALAKKITVKNPETDQWMTIYPRKYVKEENIGRGYFVAGTSKQEDGDVQVMIPFTRLNYMSIRNAYSQGTGAQTGYVADIDKMWEQASGRKADNKGGGAPAPGESPAPANSGGSKRRRWNNQTKKMEEY